MVSIMKGTVVNDIFLSGKLYQSCKRQTKIDNRFYKNKFTNKSFNMADAYVDASKVLDTLLF